MIRCIVVDDEKVIRDGIGRFISETDEFILLDSCSNGEDAYEVIIEKQPDLVICDIVMPRCNGIELICRCREKDVKCEFVFLSGYSEFEYAKAAVKYGVLEYMNKPVNRQELIRVLEKAKSIIKGKRGIHKKLKLGEYEKVFENADNIDADVLNRQKMHRVLVVNTDMGTVGERRQKNIERTVQYSEAVLKECAKEEYIVFEKNDMTVIILIGMDAQEISIKQLCHRILNYAYGNGYKAVFGIGDSVMKMQDIPLSYKKAKAAVYEASVSGINLCYFEHLSYMYKNPSGAGMRKMDEVINAIRCYDIELLAETVQAAILYYRNILPPYYIYWFVKKCWQELWDCMSEYLSEEIVKKREILWKMIETAPDFQELYRRFDDLTRSIFREAGIKQNEKSHTNDMDEILQYINLHYAGDLSIEKICSEFFFNQSYFSALFKTKTGQKYSDYVMELRINKAKELLRTGNYKIQEVAEMVGYNSSRYFSKVFKIKTGKLPQQYKNGKI